ncbi:DUF1549 domain-containing protein [Verrucomicrobiales bacterium BCK34]|nr:DUF1549 domain-containing protein [Verrucomicrobiales bacterium BCK34]
MKTAIRSTPPGINLGAGLHILLCFTLTVSAYAREWTDIQGRKVAAEYGGIEQGSVKLKLETGKVVSFPINKLSAADQAWLKAKYNSSPPTIARRIDQYVSAGLKKAGRKPNPRTTDAQFVRRTYLEITGAIPTYGQTVEFLESTNPNKRKALIDNLLDSEEYVSHTFNWYADQLRVISKLRDYINYESYIQWIKDSIKEDMPWDVFVRRLIEAEGTMFEDPASGWFLRDYGMPLNNLSATASLFLGTEITCAQCHDHPFEDWTQMDFYSLAAFLGQRRDLIANREFNEEFMTRRDEIEEEVRELKGDPDFGYENGIRLILSFNRWASHDDPNQTLKLPHDYQYDDAAPESVVTPRTLFGEDVKIEDYETPRKAFAAWATAKENPRFALAISNRIWDWAFGLPLHGPMDNISDLNHAQNPELLKFLGEAMEDLDFSVKELRRSIYYSKAWQREATTTGATEVEVGRNEYPFPGPLLKRMTAEQLWDSYMTLLVTDPYDLRRDVVTDAEEGIKMDFTTLTGGRALEQLEKAQLVMRNVIDRTAPSLSAMSEEVSGKSYRSNGDLLSYYGNYFVRASEMRQPAPDTHFLRAWGQSDRLNPESASEDGSIPQILFILNSFLTHFLADPDSMIFKKAGGVRATGEKLDQIYLSILNRPAEGKEKALCYKAIRSDDEGYSDLIWALINSREFLFVQ